MAGDLITGPWEFELAGLLLGGDSKFHVAAVAGLADVADVRPGDKPRLRRHGLRAGTDYMSGRTINLTVELDAADYTELATLVDQLGAAFRPGADEAALYFQVPGLAGGGNGVLWCRTRRRSAPITPDGWYHRLPTVELELFATDPLIYGATELTASTGLPEGGDGLIFSATFDAVFGALGESGIVVCANAGTADAPVLLRVDGPVTNPRVENITAGKTIALSLTLADGDHLLIDTQSRTVLLGGTADRYSALTSASEWFSLVPGANEVRFGASAGSGSLTVTWRSSWS